MDNFIIRKAKQSDLKEIIRLNYDLFKKEYKDFDKTLNMGWTHKAGKKIFKEKISDSKNSFLEVIEYKGKIIGYLCGSLDIIADYRNKKKYGTLDNMFIEKRFRGSGLGTKITQNFVNWCKNKKVSIISVTASSKNKPTIEFYRKNGFADYDLVLEKRLK